MTFLMVICTGAILIALNVYQLLLAMKRGSVGGTKQNEKKRKKPVTSSEKAEYFIEKLHDTIAIQIQKGKIQINKNKRHIEKPQPKNSQENRYDMSLENIEENLSLIRASIVEQKKGQEEADRLKLMQAREFINKMKKDKEEHKLKMRESEEKRQMVYAKVFSDSAMEKMRKKLDERVQIKKRQIEERIRDKLNQKSQRERSFIGQQIQYNEYLRGLKQKSKSSTRLPSIFNPQKQERNHSVLQQGRKNSLSSIKKQLYTNKSSKNIAFYLQKAIAKGHSGKLKHLQFDNDVQITKMKSNHKILLSKLENNNKPSQKQQNTSFLANRPKLYGDQYLKESILKAKRQTQPENPTTNDNNLEVKSQQALINKNQYLENLKENWLRVLSRIEHSEITEQQGIDLLHSIQKKLDKIDSKNLTERLKKKLQIFAKLHPNVEPIENKLQILQ